MDDAEIMLRYAWDAADYLLIGSTTEYWVSNPVWSPDGRKIAYIRYAYNKELIGVDVQPELWVFDLSLKRELRVAGAEMFYPAIGLAGEVSSVVWQSSSELTFGDERLPGPTTWYTFDVDRMAVVSKSQLRPTLVAEQPSSVPCFQQCDARWGGQQLGTCANTTLCSSGCAVTAVAMIFRYFGVDTDPGRLNAWLTSNGGYEQGCLLRWWVADDFAPNVTYMGSSQD